MNTERYQEALRHYNAKNFSSALECFASALGEEVHGGEVYHLMGNCCMKLTDYEQAERLYTQALIDLDYPKRGAVYANKAKAELALGRFDSALESLSCALQDAQYKSRYKLFMMMGSAYEQKAMVREAGAAYRNAALDQTNPDPIEALLKLGICFMELKRPSDAVEAYRTALDLSSPSVQRNMIFASLGQAYCALKRMDEAVSSFNQALSDGTYQLTAQAHSDFQLAQQSLRLRQDRLSGSFVSTDEILPYELAEYMRQEALQHSGAIMPSPEDTGFFDYTEKDLIKHAKKQQKAERKHRHTGLKVIAVVLIILNLCVATFAYAYYLGYGFPTQKSVAEELFKRVNLDKPLDDLWITPHNEKEKETVSELIRKSKLELPKTQEFELVGLNKSMNSSEARLKLKLATEDGVSGSYQYYLINFKREYLAWKISGVKLVFDSLSGYKLGGGTDSMNADSLKDSASPAQSFPQQASEAVVAPESDLHSEDRS